MYRVKDLKYLDIYNCQGKKIGCVEDLAIDYFGKQVKGFMTSTNMFSKKNFIPLESILTISNNIITSRISIYDGLTFNQIKNFDIINKNGDMVGIVEELIISEEDFSIKGLITAEGFFDKFINGKKILLIGETLLGDDNILYFGNSSILFKSVPHDFLRKVKCHD